MTKKIDYSLSKILKKYCKNNTSKQRQLAQMVDMTSFIH